MEFPARVQILDETVFYFMLMLLGKAWTHLFFSLSYGKIVGQAVLFNLHYVTGLGVGKLWIQILHCLKINHVTSCPALDEGVG